MRLRRSAEPAKSARRRSLDPACSGGGVRRADAVVEQLELLLRLEQPRRQAGVVEQAPEVVARVGEVSVRGRRHAARVDAAEDNLEPGREHVRDRRSPVGAISTLLRFPPVTDFLVTIAVEEVGVPGRETPGLGGGCRLVAVRRRAGDRVRDGLHEHLGERVREPAPGCCSLVSNASRRSSPDIAVERGAAAAGSILTESTRSSPSP